MTFGPSWFGLTIRRSSLRFAAVMGRFSPCAFPPRSLLIFKPTAHRTGTSAARFPGTGQMPVSARTLLDAQVAPWADPCSSPRPAWLIVLDRQGRLVWDHWDEAKEACSIAAASSPAISSPPPSSATTSGPSSICSCRATSWRPSATLCARLGVDFVNLPMPGDGFGEEWQFREILKITDDPRAASRCSSTVPGARAGPGPPWHLSVRARRLDARRCRDRDAPANLSIRLAAGLHLRHGEEQAGIAGPRPEMIDRPQSVGGFVARRLRATGQGGRA